MSWSMTVYNQITQSGAGGEYIISNNDLEPWIHGGFQATVRASGDCVELRFRGRNDLLQIEPRYIIELEIDGNDVFWGVVVRSPSLDSPGAGPANSNEDDLEEFVVLGGRELCESVIVPERLIDGSAEVSEIFKEFAGNYAHPALTFDAGRISDTARTLSMYYKPTATLAQVLDELAEAVPNFEWGVDNTGTIFFGEVTGSLSVAPADALNIELLPVEASDVVSKATVVAVGSTAGGKPDRAIVRWAETPEAALADMANVDYVPMPSIVEYEHPDHSTFAASAAFELPEGVSPFLEPADAGAAIGTIVGGGGFSDISNAYDNDGATAATGSGSLGYQWSDPLWDTSTGEYLNRVVGARIVYESGDEILVGITYILWNSSFEFKQVVVYNRTLPATDSADGPADFYFVFPPDARMAPLNDSGFDSSWTYQTQVDIIAAGVSSLYYFYPLIVDEDLVSAYAESSIRLPSYTPSEVTVSGYSAPVASVLVDGYSAAGGLVGTAEADTDVVGESVGGNVELITYRNTPEEGVMTTFRIDTEALAEQNRAIRQYTTREVRRGTYASRLAVRD